jgi:4-alpha-glucanotransferase
LRESGILLHISSLPSKYGIGTLGKSAYDFVDFLKSSSQSYWQVLPINPTGYGDSPYQGFSVFAGNPYFIDLDILCEKNWLNKNELDQISWSSNPKYIDYEKIYAHRFHILKKAYKNSFQSLKYEIEGFTEKEKYWLLDYARYMAIKDLEIGKSWQEWKENSTLYNNANFLDKINFYIWQQYIFYEQWFNLKSYANKNGIKIFGDIPIYVALDSADTYSCPDMFLMNKTGIPTKVAGCPPDCFSSDGQLWGNPLYNWDYLEKTNYKWWVLRLKNAIYLYDIVRIDHFRGFDEYYAIPYGDKNAKNGKWIKGPNIELFEAILKELGNLPIVAEDLGFITESVLDLLKKSGFPGMYVLQFAFSKDGKSYHLPHNYEKNSVVYTGTHDNDTTLGWLNSENKEDINFCKKYLAFSNDEDGVKAIIKTALSSVCNLAIIPMQDWLMLSSFARMNIPSTLGDNWKWRILSEQLTEKLASEISELTILYDRI